MPALYYIQRGSISDEGYALWWKKNSYGYTRNINAAKAFTEKESKEVCASLNKEKDYKRWPVDFINAKATKKGSGKVVKIPIAERIFIMAPTLQKARIFAVKALDFKPTSQDWHYLMSPTQIRALRGTPFDVIELSRSFIKDNYEAVKAELSDMGKESIKIYW